MIRELAAFVCSHVFTSSRPVLLVARENGDWMYLCGTHHGADENYHVVGKHHLAARDSSLKEVDDLPDNTEAERRDVGAPWVRRHLLSP